MFRKRDNKIYNNMFNNQRNSTGRNAAIWFSFVGDIMADFLQYKLYSLYFKFCSEHINLLSRKIKVLFLKQSQILQTLPNQHHLADDCEERQEVHITCWCANDELFMPPLTVSGIQAAPATCIHRRFKFMTFPHVVLGNSHFLHRFIKQLCVLLYGISVFENSRIIQE